jgi:hypothetical protein
MNPLRAISLLLCATLCAAQSPTTKPKAATPATGEVDGFVFAITKGGDIKPARLASVALLYYAERPLGPNDKIPQSVGGTFITDHGNEMIKESQSLLEESRTRKFRTPLARCLASLQGYLAALKFTFEWASQNGKMADFVVADADEEGHFKVLQVPIGAYVVVASGQAGTSQAFWEQDNVEVIAGQVTSIKMATPKEACAQP